MQLISLCAVLFFFNILPASPLFSFAKDSFFVNPREVDDLVELLKAPNNNIKKLYLQSQNQMSSHAGQKNITRCAKICFERFDAHRMMSLPPSLLAVSFKKLTRQLVSA